MKCPTVSLMIVTVLLMTQVSSVAQTKRPQSSKSSNNVSEREVMALANRIVTAKGAVASAANDYKASLERLLARQENDVKAAEETVERRKELLAQSVITKKEFEESERALSTAEAKVRDTKRQFADADDLIAEARVESVFAIDYARRLLSQKKKLERTPNGRVYHFRFIIVGELTIYEYSGAIRGLMLKHRNQVKYDSRQSF